MIIYTVFIGESENAKEGILNQDLRTHCESYLKGNEELIYTYAPLSENRVQALAALVFRHHPVGNEQFWHHFLFGLAGKTVTGKSLFLQITFVVPDDGDIGRISPLQSHDSEADKQVA